METKVKNRDWVKNAAIIFLSVLLVLTFFSNTIMNRSLPEVATAQVQSGNIVAKVRGTGTVTANGVNKVKAKEIRTIRSVMVKVGQEVNAGDVLFVLGEGDATELETARDTLRDLQYTYQKTAVSIPNFDYSSYQRSINNAQKALDRAITARDEAKKICEEAVKTYGLHNIEEIKTAALEVEALKIALDTAREELAIAKENLDSLDEDEAAAQAKVDAIKERIAVLQKQIEDMENEEASPSPSPSPSPDPADGQGGGDPADDTNSTQNQSQFGSGDPDAFVPVEGGSNSTEPAEPTAPASDPPTTPPEEPVTPPTIEPTVPSDPAPADPTPSEPASDPVSDPVSAEGVAVKKTSGRFVTLTAGGPAGRTGGYVALADSEELARLKAELYQLENFDLPAAEQELQTIQNYKQEHGSDSAKEEAQKNYEKCLEAYHKAVEKYKSKVPASVLPYVEDYESAEKAVRDAQDDLYFAQMAYQTAADTNNKTAAVSYIDLQQLAEKIRLQQEKIRSLAGDEENVITANVSGTIESIECTAGDTVLKDAVLCSIEVPDMGHTLSFSVTNDQARRLRIGDSATVSNSYWGNSVTATLTTIRTDPKNPQTNKLLTFDLVGDVTTGADMTISVGQKSASYDIIIPNSAIKSDSNGSFVLVVNAKSSPLGNRYSARRVSIEVLASDDNNSAVVADLNNGDYVITTSSAPLRSGDLVRMADNG